MNKRRILLILPLVVGLFYMRMLASWRPRKVFQGVGYASNLVFSHDGKTLLVLYRSPPKKSGNMRGKDVQVLDVHRGFAPLWPSRELPPSNTDTHLQFSADNRRVLASGTPSQSLDAQTGQVQPQLKSSSYSEVSPDGKCYASFTNQGQLRITSTRVSNLSTTIAVLGAPNRRIRQFAFSPDGKTLVAGTGDFQGAYLDLYDTRTWKRQRILRESVSPSTKDSIIYETLKWSHNGQFLVSQWWRWGGDSCVSVWRISDGQRVLQNIPPLALFQVEDDGRVLYSQRGTVTRGNLDKGEKLLSLHSKNITAAAISPDGTYLVAGTVEGQLVYQRLK